MCFFKSLKNLLILLCSCSCLWGCAAPEILNPETTPPEVLYNKALDDLTLNGEYTKAIKRFDEIEQYYPYSRWALRSQIMMAFGYYIKREYDDSLIVLNRFLQLYPGNSFAPYAYYLKALNYYAQLSDTNRDQKMTENALEALQEVIDRYPDSDYAKDAQQKIILSLDYLAAKQVNIGRFYLMQNKHVAAMNRFAFVVKNYQTTQHIEEALYRLTETYLILGLDTEAQKSAAILGYNYPNSVWYEKAFALMKKHVPNSLKPTK